MNNICIYIYISPCICLYIIMKIFFTRINKVKIVQMLNLFLTNRFILSYVKFVLLCAKNSPVTANVPPNGSIMVPPAVNLPKNCIQTLIVCL